MFLSKFNTFINYFILLDYYTYIWKWNGLLPEVLPSRYMGFFKKQVNSALIGWQHIGSSSRHSVRLPPIFNKIIIIVMALIDDQRPSV